MCGPIARPSLRDTSDAYLSPAPSLSGQITIRRPSSGPQSKLSAELAPLAETQAQSSNLSAPPCRAFGPSVIKTFASGFDARASKPYSDHGLFELALPMNSA